MLHFLLLFLFIPNQTDCLNMPQVRSAYGDIKTEKQLNAFFDLLERVDCSLKTSYLASATMQKAQFAFAPWTKYRYFLKGKKMLEEYIAQNPYDIEARYVRFLVQSHVPGFLGYKSNLKEDEDLIRNRIKQADMGQEYKTKILYHLDLFSKKK